MYWIIQENLWNEEGHSILLQALEKNGSEYTIVKVRPFIHTIEPDINPPNPVMVIGSTTLVQIGKTRRWFPNAFINRNFDFRVQKEHWPMLNHDAFIGQFGSIDPPWEPFFIRPPEDSKLFTGQIMDHDELDQWKRDTSAAYSDGFTQLTPDTMVMVARPRAIWQEFRLFIVDKKFITGSEYKRGGRSYQNSSVDPDVIEFAEILCRRWVPDFAFCMDVARTEHGLKVIEVNCINSSGFYKSDVSKTIQVLEAMYT